MSVAVTAATAHIVGDVAVEVTLRCAPEDLGLLESVLSEVAAILRCAENTDDSTARDLRESARGYEVLGVLDTPADRLDDLAHALTHVLHSLADEQVPARSRKVDLL